MPPPNIYPLHGGQLRQIAEQFGVDRAQLLDFSANINPDGPPASVLSRLRESLEDIATLAEYPDLQQTDIKQALAGHIGMGKESILVGNGFAPLLEATLRALKIRSCTLTFPAFVEYRKTLERAGVAVVPHYLDPLSNFQYDPHLLLAQKADAILIANPQNPSGVSHNAESIRALVTRASREGIYVLLDEAFIDYVPGDSVTTILHEFANLIIFRSLTKFHAVPGLRVAYAATSPIMAAAIGGYLPPWPITTLASLAAIAAVEDQPYALRSRSENLARRGALERDLESLGLSVYPSAANFVLFRSPGGVDPDALWRALIVRHGIVMRACANYEGLPGGHFRVAVRTGQENKKLTLGLEAVLFALRDAANLT